MTGPRPMDAAACLDAINNGDDDAYDLIMAADPNLRTRFKCLDGALIKLLKDVRRHFPEAQYYTASGGFNLMLGSPHSDSGKGEAQQQLIALSGYASIGDGDF